MPEAVDYAPGAPGIPARWTSSAKTGAGTSLSPSSRVWFTLSHGIFNEIYYPDVDQACTRDMGLIVTNGADFFSEEKRHTEHRVAYIADGVPAFHLVNTCKQGRYRIEKDILTDPRRDVVLQRTLFVPLQGSLNDYHLYVLLSPHIGNRGASNTASIGNYKSVPMLFAGRGADCLALACTAPWLKRSAGFVGTSDGWQDLMAHKCITRTYARAENGNVALTAEIDLQACEGRFVLALGFGRSFAESGNRARASLLDGFETVQADYIREWEEWQKTLSVVEGGRTDGVNLHRTSAAVLRTHEAKRVPGGMIASLSVPWGFAKGDDDLGGYHLVWPRDLVEAAGGLLAAGAREDVHRALHYLQVTQEGDGCWPQNMWLDGVPYWTGIQMDETAFPVLLVDLARREETLDSDDLARLWPMVRKAAAYLACNGPVTQQDRWEEDPGYSPFTLAVEIAALLVAADMADLNNEPATAQFLREMADAWNTSIERWTYVTGTELARQVGVEGYYVRIAPPQTADAASPAGGFVPIKNRPIGEGEEPVAHIISPDALALVRFGLRKPDDPRILNTLKVIDTLLKVETPCGPAWHRYNDDGYGEHEDGSPFDGTGKGRLWPLLVGERAHYELAAGHGEEAEKLLKVMEAFANEGGMIPEQIWDQPDIPERELFFGKPSGSAMPLVWAHAEYIKLLRSIRDGRVFDLPPQTVQRYLVGRTGFSPAIWRFNQKLRAIQQGKALRVVIQSAATVHWSGDDWQTASDVATRDTGMGIHVADLPTGELPEARVVRFTFHWTEADRWEGINYEVRIVKPAI